MDSPQTQIMALIDGLSIIARRDKDAVPYVDGADNNLAIMTGIEPFTDSEIIQLGNLGFREGSLHGKPAFVFEA